MSRLIEKMTDMFTTMLTTIVSTLTSKISESLLPFTQQIGVLTERVRVIESSEKSRSSQPPKDTQVLPEQSLQVLIAIEKQKTEKALRNRNVVISGLPPKPGHHDADLLLEFCEEHLTVAPHPFRESCRRLGRLSGSGPQRLKVTLESEFAVDDLISASRILRDSTDHIAKNVFINRDLTPAESKLAYDQRCLRRQKSNPSSVLPASYSSAVSSGGTSSGLPS